MQHGLDLKTASAPRCCQQRTFWQP